MDEHGKYNFNISIHAPTRGATVINKSFCHKPIFQSTLPQGERRCMPFTIAGITLNFNPRSHKGSDFLCANNSNYYMVFQSTLPQGERHKHTTAVCQLRGFQSTLPQGERQQFYTKFHICFISFLPILSPYHISTHSPLPTFNHFLYIFSGANRPEISCLLPFRTKTISGIL